MANKTAFRARELSLSQGHINYSSTFRTSLACIPCIDFHQFRTACYSFVFQIPDESIPRSISYTFSQPVTFQHRCDVELLNIDDSKFLSYCHTEFVQKITPLVSNFDMLFSQSKSCLSSVSTSFNLSTQSSAQELQSMFRLNEMSWVSYDFTIAQSCEVFQSNVNWSEPLL